MKSDIIKWNIKLFAFHLSFNICTRFIISLMGECAIIKVHMEHDYSETAWGDECRCCLVDESDSNLGL